MISGWDSGEGAHAERGDCEALSEGEQHERGDDSHHAKERMEQKHHCDINRQPRRVEEREESRAGEELPQLEEIAKRLCARDAAAGIECLPEH